LPLGNYGHHNRILGLRSRVHGSGTFTDAPGITTSTTLRGSPGSSTDAGAVRVDKRWRGSTDFTLSTGGRVDFWSCPSLP